MIKRITSIFLAVALTALIPFLGKAAGAETSLFYTNISSIDISISYGGSVATCSADVVGMAGTGSISITLSIQRKESNGSYTTLKTWDEESMNDDAFYLSKTYAVERGKNYRTYAEVKVMRNGNTEAVSSYSGTVKC